MTPTDLYTLIKAALDASRARIAEAGYTYPIGITIWSGNRYTANDELSIHITGQVPGAKAYSLEDLSVKGKDFIACTDEFIHRAQFHMQQSTLQLGPPVIDQE